MIKHPRFGHLRAFAKGELMPRRRRLTTAHLAGCARCRDMVAWVRAARQAALEATGAPAPEGAWERIAARVRAGETVLLPVEGEAPVPGRAWRRSGVRAAVLVLAFAGAASAWPGSPVRSWLGRAPSLAGGAGAPLATPDAVPTGPSVEEAPGAALLVPPLDGAVAIAIEVPDPRLRIRVRLSEAGEVEVRATGGAASARFRSGPGRLAIVEAGAGEVTLALPRSVQKVLLEVNGRRYLTKERGQIRILAPVADTAGSEIVLPVRP